MNLGQMLFNGKCKVFAPFYYIPMEIGIKYFLQGNFSIKIINILKSASNLNGNLNCSKELEHYAS